MRHPEPGDVKVAFDKIDDRARATLPDSDTHMHYAGCGTFDPTTGTFTGEAADKFHLAYGDLFIVDEVLEEGGLSLVSSTAESWLQWNDAGSALTSLLLQSMAIGVLMERARWERPDGA